MEALAKQNPPTRLDRSLAVLILLLTLFAYAYVFQGLGWNQMAHFATIRSIAEHATADIASFADDTQDTMILGTRQYSSKPPGLPLLGVPFYFILIHIERWLGIDFNAPAVWLKNLHAMTVLLCALPGAILNAMLYFAFRREGATPRTSMLLAGGFAFGSLSLPYAGLFMSHVLCSLLVFAAWYKITSPVLRQRDVMVAGAIIGYCNFCDLLTSVVTMGLALYLVVRGTQMRYCIAYAIGPCTALFALLIYDRVAYGSAGQISTLHPAGFYNPHLLLGQFDWPDIRRIYWITFQPMRGLISCCPEFVLCLFVPLLLLRDKAKVRFDLLAILPILAGYLLFYMTFFWWTGGWALGPRFLIPALPLVWMFALRPFQQMPIISGLVIALSVLYMLTMTSVSAVVTGPPSGPPTANDPIKANLSVFLHGRVDDLDGTETLGGLMGVPKQFLIFPFLLPVAVYFCIAFALPRATHDHRRSSREPASSFTRQA